MRWGFMTVVFVVATAIGIGVATCKRRGAK